MKQVDSLLPGPSVCKKAIPRNLGLHKNTLGVYSQVMLEPWVLPMLHEATHMEFMCICVHAGVGTESDSLPHLCCQHDGSRFALSSDHLLLYSHVPPHP